VWQVTVPPHPLEAVPAHWLAHAFEFGVQPHTPAVPPPPHVFGATQTELLVPFATSCNAVVDVEGVQTVQPPLPS
jgi:hypothetical protein